MSQSDLSKSIKALNQRIKDFEIHGFQVSSQYRTLVGALRNSGIPLKTTASGYTAIPNSKAINDDMAIKIQNLVKSKTLTMGVAKDRAKEMLEQIGETSSTEGMLIVKSTNMFVPSIDELHNLTLQQKLDVYKEIGIRGLETLDQQFADLEKTRQEWLNNGISWVKNISDSELQDAILDDFISGLAIKGKGQQIIQKRGYDDQQLADVMEMSENVHEIIKNKAQQIYALATQGYIEDVRGNNGRLTYGQMWELTHMDDIEEMERSKAFHDYEQQQMERANMLYDSGLDVDPFDWS